MLWVRVPHVLNRLFKKVFRIIVMKEYHKINSIFKRDLTKKNKPFIVGDWAEPEFGYLQNNKWEWQEKIDGTNIRVMLNSGEVIFGGRTDNAQIPAHLVTELQNKFLTIERKQLLKEVFGEEWKDICLYGEGFGYKIQGKVGVDYLKQGVDFTLFDIRIGNWWLKREDVYGIADRLGLSRPAVIGYGTINEAVELVKTGFKSHFGTADAEGLILRPTVELLTRDGDRIITKVKCRDFINL